ncbi:hypothetical protein HBH86_166380 [Parastagonospora nodorum]|nr:hypothetical protein HBH86_166380 [Parastagonospora nodorum]
MEPAATCQKKCATETPVLPGAGRVAHAKAVVFGLSLYFLLVDRTVLGPNRATTSLPSTITNKMITYA